MPAFLPDTSCMIAALCVWHEHHPRAAAEMERRLARRERMLIAGPALVESYAVLTRLPTSHRLAPVDALTLLQANFMDAARVVSLDARAYCELLRAAPTSAIQGGRTYDAVIAACARKAGARVLLTFNEGHFLPFSGPGLDVVVP